MTALAVLAEARGRGLTITADGDRLRIRAPAGALTPDLRRHLGAVRPELLQLLASSASRARSASDAWAAAYGRLARAATDWPTGGLDLLNSLRPGLLREVMCAELQAERATLAYRDGAEAGPEAFVGALARWEGLMLTAIEWLGRICHDCGHPVVVALVDTATGSRLCGNCARPGGEP